MKYVCVVCGFVYEPAIGDPDCGVDPGTAFFIIYLPFVLLLM